MFRFVESATESTGGFIALPRSKENSNHGSEMVDCKNRKRNYLFLKSHDIIAKNIALTIIKPI